MPSRKRRMGERFRFEFVAIILGIAAVFLCAPLALVFFPGVIVQTPAYLAALPWGIVLMFSGFGFWGLILGFRYHTDKVISKNRIWECSSPKMLKLDPESYPIDEDKQLNDPLLSDAEKEELTKRGLVASGRNEKGDIVAQRALALGGFWWGGFAIGPGKDGYVLFHGKEWVDLYGNVFIPRNLELIHHSEVDERVLSSLEGQTKGSGAFIPYKTPLYVPGDFDEDLADYLRTSPEVRAMVLESIGINGACRMGARQALIEIGPEKWKELGLGPDGFEAIVERLVTPIRDYLHTAGLYSEAAERGIQTVGTLRAEVRRLQDKITALEFERKTNIATIQGYVDMVHGNMRRDAGYRGGYSVERPTPPGFADRTRPGSDRTQEGQY